MTSRSGPDAYIGQIAAALLVDVDQLAGEVAAVIAERVPELAAEPVVGREIAASTRANVVRFLSSLATSPGEPIPAGVPLEALDLARTFVRRGIDLEVLAHVYRWGQNVAWRRWMVEAGRRVPARDYPAVLEASAALLFTFVDDVLRGMVEQVDHERAQLMAGVAARREQTIRLLIEGAPIAPETAGQRLDYRLDGAHTAVVLWADPAAQAPHGALESLAEALARSARATSQLISAPGRHALWAWLTTPSGISTSELADAVLAAPSGLRAAIGGRHAGVEGFRRSHEEALAAQRLLAGGDRRFVSHADVEVIALMASDAERLSEFVVETLAPLRAAANSAALLDTLRVYLDEGGNAASAAIRLGTHRNTVLSRLARARELLGHDVTERRLSVAVALEAVYHLGWPGSPAAAPRE
ncbi:MAG: helix-turn-helix domain-containing protein [Solirubrobacteraceae bacterium]|nr:helix-turn-helix domain-containing protein [Solirubrobacteraceae bacterium]